MIRAAILARVSTAGQVDGTSLPEQIRLCQLEADRLGWQVVMIREDPGVSGGELDRPALNEVMQACHQGEIDAVLVHHQDRLARDETVRHLIERDLRSLSIRYRPLNLPAEVDPFDEAEGEMTAGMFGVMAQYQRRQRQWGSARGQRAKAREGRWPGGTPPYGYRLEGSRKTAEAVPDPAEREIIDAGYEALVDRGMTTGQTATLLNGLGYRRRSGVEWTHQTVRRQFESEGLKGVVWWGKATRRYGAGHHTKKRPDGSNKYGEPLLLRLADPPLSDEKWDALQRALRRTAYGDKKAAKPYPMSGAVTACGGKLGGAYRKDRDLRQYRCNRNKWVAGRPPQCDCARINADWLDGVVWREVVAMLTDPDRLIKLAGDYLGWRATRLPAEQDKLRKVERQILNLEQARVKRAADALKAGVPADLLAAAIQEIDGEIATLKGYRADLSAQKANQEVEQERTVELARLAAFAAERCGEMGLAEQAQVLALLQVSVTLQDTTERPGVHIEGVLPGGSLQVLEGRSTPGYPGDAGLRSPARGVTTPGVPFSLAA